MVRGKKQITPLFSAMLILLACASTASQQVVVTLNPEVTLQTVTGWEATTQAGHVEYKMLYPRYKEALLDITVNDLGINRLRLEIFNGVENPVDYFSQFYNDQISFNAWKAQWFKIINDNDDPFVINPAGYQFSLIDRAIDDVVLPIRQRLQARGEKLYLSLNHIDFGPSDFEHKDHPEEYAEFMLAAFLHLRDKYGWWPDAIEITLEADNAGWTGTQIGQAIVATGNRLKAYGFHPEFIAPSTTSMGNAITFFDEMIRVPGVTEYLSELSYHRYRDVSDDNLRVIGSRAVRYGIKTAHLELIGATYEDLHKDLTLGRNSAWAQYTLAFPFTDGSDDGAQYYVVDVRNSQSPVVQIGSRTKFLRQYFKYVRSGAVRIQATSNNAAYEPLAFINADCKPVAIIKADRGAAISIQGLPAGSYGIKYTTEAQFDVDGSDAAMGSGQVLLATIPAKGVITVYAKSVNCAPLVNASAASYRQIELATESLVAAFGKNLAGSTSTAQVTPLPTTLGGTMVKVKDATGVERLAPLIYVSPQQINYQIPTESGSGPATISVIGNAGIHAIAGVTIKRVAPGLFTANGSGQGVAAAVALRVKANGSQSYEAVSRFDQAQGKFIPIPIDLGPETDQVFLVLYGTGVRHHGGLATVAAKIGGVDAPVIHAIPQPNFTGLDQITLRLPRSLSGRGETEILLLVEGKSANPVSISIR